jgi:hypothetical protein
VALTSTAWSTHSRRVSDCSQVLLRAGSTHQHMENALLMDCHCVGRTQTLQYRTEILYRLSNSQFVSCCLLLWNTGKVTKPVVAWVSGTCAKLFKSEVQFGHAGARSTGESDSAQVSCAYAASKRVAMVLVLVTALPTVDVRRLLH